jgi:hypothetical protein
MNTGASSAAFAMHEQSRSRVIICRLPANMTRRDVHLVLGSVLFGLQTVFFGVLA